MTEASSWRPKVYHDTEAYWAGCTRRELIIARCRRCSRWQHPPRAVCPQCWSDEIAFEPVSGRAKLFTFTSVDKAGPREEPVSRVTVWAELEEQSRLIVVADLVGGGPADISIGDDLILDWRAVGEFSVPVFRKVAS